MTCCLCCAPTLQALLWARKARALLARLPFAAEQQEAAPQAPVEVKQEAGGLQEPQRQAEPVQPPQAVEDKVMAEVAAVQERLLEAVEAAEGAGAEKPGGGAALTPYAERPMLSGVPGCLSATSAVASAASTQASVS